MEFRRVLVIEQTNKFHLICHCFPSSCCIFWLELYLLSSFGENIS